MACDVPITEIQARSIYDHLLANQGGDGCTLDELATEQTHMTAVWKKAGDALPAAEIVGRACAPAGAVVGPSLAISVPQPLRSACPSTAQAAIEIVQRASFGAPGGGSLRPLAVSGAAVALAVVIFTVTMVLRHRPVGTQSPAP